MKKNNVLCICDLSIVLSETENLGVPMFHLSFSIPISKELLTHLFIPEAKKICQKGCRLDTKVLLGSKNMARICSPGMCLSSSQ